MGSRIYLVGSTRWNRLVDALWWNLDGPFLGSSHRLVIWGIRTLAGHGNKSVEEDAYEILRRR